MAPSLQVENQSGLSNFIPVLVGDKETCAEMEILQQKSGTPSSSHEREHSSPQPACGVLASRQAEFNELVLDVAWLLKKPTSEQKLTSSHILRSNCLLEYLMEKESTVVLEGLCLSLRSAIDNNLVDGDSDSDVRLLQKNIDVARRRLAPRSHEKVVADTPVPSGDRCSRILENDTSPLVPFANQVYIKRLNAFHSSQRACNRVGYVNDYNAQKLISQGLRSTVRSLLGLVARPPSSPDEEDATVPLLKDEVIMNVDLQERPRGSCSLSLSRTLSTSRLLIVAVMAVGVCFGACAAVLHPQRVGRISSTIHSCLFNISQR